ncbi:MAG: DUF72 domain-containing protein [Verrucomicrobiota bacterium]|nr:DUF72 domain-containing protein [Verrucomicrobiota bacterium]
MPGPARSQKPRGRILVGTASWSDPGFVEHWYPKGMPASERLMWYAEQFEMVEVNSTFYSVPAPRMVERWCEITPNEFIFDVKLHQLLSRHSTAAKFLPPALQKRAETDGKGKVKLTPALEAAVLQEFLRGIASLREAGKLGALLLQLSPSFSPRHHELAELRPLLEQLSDYEVAVEFRNRNWAEDGRLAEMLEFLREHRAAFVMVDAPAAEHFMIMPPELDATTNDQLAYLRLHGRNAKAYTTGKTVAARFDYDYDDTEIEEVAERAKNAAREAKRVHVVFNNNNLDYAPHAALRLRKALGQIVRAPARQPDLFATK